MRFHIFHCFHATGRKAKVLADKKHPSGDVIIMTEGKCCQCPKRKWIKQYFPGDHGDVDLYPQSNEYAKNLPWLSEVSA